MGKSIGSGLSGILLRLLLASSFVFAGKVSAHPGSGILITANGELYFVDTGKGVWKMDVNGRLQLAATVAYHWMAADESGRLARSQGKWEQDGGSFERITPEGSTPAIIVSSDYPIVAGPNGALYYVPYREAGPRELVSRMPDGSRSVAAILPPDASGKPMQWVNGLAMTGDGSIYFSDNDAVRRVGRDGKVSTIREALRLSDCEDPLDGVPKLPYLRGISMARHGTIYAAANGCRTVIAIPARGPVRTVLRAERPWSPTSVAVKGDDLYVLEYLQVGDDREQWIPRVRKLSAGGTNATIVACPQCGRE